MDSTSSSTIGSPQKSGVRKCSYPRGHFKQTNPWSKDKTTAYYQGTQEKVIFPILKSMIAISIGYGLKALT